MTKLEIEKIAGDFVHDPTNQVLAHDEMCHSVDYKNGEPIYRDCGCVKIVESLLIRMFNAGIDEALNEIYFQPVEWSIEKEIINLKLPETEEK